MQPTIYQPLQYETCFDLEHVVYVVNTYIFQIVFRNKIPLLYN